MQEKRRPCRFGIQARVVGLAMLFTLLIAAVLLVSSAGSLSEQLRRSTLQSAEYTAQIAADGIRQDIIEVDALPNWCVLNYTARAAMFTDFSPSTLAHTAYPIISNRYGSMRTALYIQRFLIFTSSGRTIMLGTAVNQSQYVTSECMPRFFGEEAEDGQLPQWDRIAEDPMMQPGVTMEGIPIARVIRSGSGTARIYLSVSPKLITDTLDKFSVEEGAWLCWIMGDELYRVDGDELVSLGSAGQLLKPEPESGGTLDEGTLLYSARMEGNDCSLVICPLGIHDLSLGVVLPDSLMEYPLHLLLRPALASLGMVLLMGLGLAMLLSRVVGAPIRALQRQIETVSQGSFATNPDIEWSHELGDVGRGINRLSQSVSELMSKRLEDEKQRLALEYRMLQNQISPHFIYNTLNSIKWMATIQHAPGVAEMVTALSHLLKNVSKGNQRLVPLEEEFALLDDYFTIQRYRYGGTITLDVPKLDGDDPLRRCLIPRFTLQPLAENAIFHGIEPNGGIGRVTVTIEQGEGEVRICMADDGVGMTQAQIDRILAGPQDEEEENHRFRHVGMWNVHRLLQLSFGPDYGLSITSAPGQGAAITIRLPRQDTAVPPDPA